GGGLRGPGREARPALPPRGRRPPPPPRGPARPAAERVRAGPDPRHVLGSRADAAGRRPDRADPARARLLRQHRHPRPDAAAGRHRLGVLAPGYDLVVDTEAMPLASHTRITTIFFRAAETAQRLGVPVIVGEWGAFGRHEGIAGHAAVQLEMFDGWAWSWFYWCWEPGFATSEAAQVLRRPRPRAVAGRDLRC